MAIAKAVGIPPLIALVRKSSPQAQDYAARAIWHLATQQDNQTTIADSGGIKPFVAMLSCEGENMRDAAELSAVNLARLARMTPETSVRESYSQSAPFIPLISLRSYHHRPCFFLLPR